MEVEINDNIVRIYTNYGTECRERVFNSPEELGKIILEVYADYIAEDRKNGSTD